MRILAILFFCVFSSYPALTQTFKIESESKLTGSIGSQLKSAIFIKNLTNKPLHLQIKRIGLQLGSTQNTYFCWGVECFENQVSQLPSSKTIEGGGVTSKFSAVFEAGLVSSLSTVKYLIYDVNNPADSVIHEIKYQIEDPDSKKLLFHNKDIQISNVYPNPVSNHAFINYTLTSKRNQAQIIIHNVLGGIVGEYELPSYDTKIKISTAELNPGVYFYTLRLDNNNVITKKMVIKR